MITSAKVLLFANDVKIYLKTLNVDKCNIMSFNRSKSPFQYKYILTEQYLAPSSDPHQGPRNPLHLFLKLLAAH